jgi:hypothetical protein
MGLVVVAGQVTLNTHRGENTPMKDTLTTILTTSTVRGDGSLERRTQALGTSAAQVRHTTIDQHMLLDLVRLLVQLDVWEQPIPDRPPVPDERRAALTISVNGSASRMWEQFNDLVANNRLVQFKTWLEQA